MTRPETGPMRCTWRERFMRREATVADIAAMISPDGERIIERLGLSPAEFVVYINNQALFERAMTWEREGR